MRVLATKKIDYTFLQVFPFTMKMTNQLKQWYDSFLFKNLPMEVTELSSLEDLSLAIEKGVANSLKSAKK